MAKAFGFEREPLDLSGFDPEQDRKDIRGRVPPGSQPLTPEPEQKEPRALLRDQLFAGFDEMRANRASMDALDAADNLANAKEIATGNMSEGGIPNTGGTAAEIDRRIVAARAKYGNDEQKAEALRVIEDDTKRIRSEQLARLQEAIDSSAKLRARASTVPFSKDTRDMLEAETFQEGINEFTDDPIMIIAETSLRSLPNMAEAIPLAVAGAVIGGPMGFMSGMGAGSGMTEYRAAFSGYLTDNGVDINSASDLLEASQSDDLMRRAHDFAGKRAGAIGLFSAASGGVATRPLTPFVKNVLGRELSNVGAQVVVQAGLEGSGEAVAQKITTGELDPGEVLAEVTGSLAQTPIEVGMATVTGVRAEAVEKQRLRIEKEVDEILGSKQRQDIDSAIENAVSDLNIDPESDFPVPRETTTREANQVEIHDERKFRASHAGEFDIEQFPETKEQRQILNAIDREAHKPKAIDEVLENLTQGAREEFDFIMDGLEDGDNNTAFDDLVTKIDDGTSELSRSDITSIRKAAIDLGIYRPITDQELANTVTLGGKKFDFTLNKQKYVWDKNLNDSGDGDVLAVKQPPIDRRQESASVDVDRRKADRRDRLSRMSLDELVDAYYTDSLTGLGNRSAFMEEINQFSHVASIDADSLKWINDNLGHDAGDAMLKAIGESLIQNDVTAYRLGGDEFYIAGESRDSVQAALSLAEGILANQTVKSPKGQKQGIEITGAIGENKADADAAMESAKKAKKSRPDRGVLPTGVTLKALKPLNMAPGTNYVPMIGNTGALPIDANYNLILQSTGLPVQIPKVPVRREHAIALMQKHFGKRIYTGRVKGKNVGGFYRPGQGEVRLKRTNDIEVAAHEIAHFLDDRYPWIKRLYSKYKKEVKSVSYDESLIFEGWAEFMRLWMTQESEAMKRAPSFYDAFNKEAKNHPKIWHALTDLQELMHAWTMQGARARGASKHGHTIGTVMGKIMSLFNQNVFQAALDGLRSIKTIAADLSDQQAPQVQDAYERLRLAIGGANGVLEAAMFYGTPKWREDGQGIELGGKPLVDIWGDDWGDNDVAMYMIARRAAELMEQGRENLMRPDEIAAWLDLEKQRPELATKFEQHQEFNQQLLDFAEQAGILGSETREAFVAMNQNYVPFHRVVESRINGTKVQAGGNPFMRLSGGTQNIANIWDNIVNNSGLIIRMAMINDGKRSLFKALGGTGRLGGTQQNQQAGVYAAPIAKDIKPVKVHSEQILRTVVESMGLTWKQYTMGRDTGMYPAGKAGDEMQAMVQMIERMAHSMEAMTTFWQFNQDPKGDNIDFYMEDGDKKFFEINDPNLMDSLRFLGPRGTNLVLAITGAFSATLRRGAIGVPVFQVKNFIRDSTNAWLLSSHIKVPAVRAMRSLLKQMSKDPAYVDMLLNGGGFASRSQGLQSQRKMIVDPTRLTAFYDRFMSRFENANRLAEYKAATEDGVSPRKAALLSREISTDFAMRGSSELARYLAISVPFLNARVQGLYRIKRQFDLKETATSYALRGLMLASASIALYMLNKDDERYKELPEDIKDLNWVFFTGDGEDDYVLMPKPFESGALFGTLPERMMEYAEQENGQEFADAIGWMILQTFHMDMTPQVFQPWQDLKANRNFAGAPIVPHYLDNVEPTEQFSYYTSESVKAAAQALGMSPIKTEYVLRGYTATLGTYAIGAADALIRAVTDADMREFGEDPTRGETWKENILVKGLIDPLINEGPPRRTKYVTDLYDMLREAQKVTNTVALHEKRNLEKIEGYLDDPKNQVQFITSEALNNARKQLSEIRTSMDRIRQHKEMTGDEKRVELWHLTRERNKVARQVVIEIQSAQQAAENAQ